ALHGTPVSLEAITCPADVLNDLRPRVTELCARFPGEADVLRDTLFRLEHAAPSAPAAPSFLHGDFGTANLLWRPGRLVVLDFDLTGRPEADARRRRQVEAVELLRCLVNGRDSVRSS